LSINEGAIAPWGNRDSFYVKNILASLAQHYGFSLDTPLKNLPRNIRDVLLHGYGDEKIELVFEGENSLYKTQKPFQGILNYFNKKYHETDSENVRDELTEYMNQLPCPECGGRRLRRESLSIKIGGRSIHDVNAMNVDGAIAFFRELHFNGSKADIAAPLLKEISDRLFFLSYLGLNYLTLDRIGGTL